MSRDTYIVVRIDHVLVPSSVDYLGHGDTPYDLNVRYTHFRDSATRYSTKRDAIKQAKQSARVFSSRVYKVVGFYGCNTVWTSR